MARIIPRLSRDIAKQLGVAGLRRPKYGAERVLVDGILFDSKKEATRYQELRLLERAGEIRLVMRQVPFQLSDTVLGPDGKVASRGERWVADFVIHWADGRLTVEDAKGHRTETFIRKKKRAEALYGIRVEEVQ